MPERFRDEYRTHYKAPCKCPVYFTFTALRNDYRWFLISHTVCTANRCAPVPVVQDAVPDSYLAVQGTVVHYTCVDGFTPLTVSPQSTTCDGMNWTPIELPGCESTQETSDESFLSALHMHFLGAYALGGGLA